MGGKTSSSNIFLLHNLSRGSSTAHVYYDLRRGTFTDCTTKDDLCEPHAVCMRLCCIEINVITMNFGVPLQQRCSNVHVIVITISKIKYDWQKINAVLF